MATKLSREASDATGNAVNFGDNVHHHIKN